MIRTLSLLTVVLISWAFCYPSLAGISFELDQSSITNTGGNNYFITAVLRLDNIGANDLSTPPRLSSVNFGVAFTPSAPGLSFVDISAPLAGEIFVTNRTYSSGSPDLALQIFGSVISNASGSDPFGVNGGRLFNINFTATNAVTGTHALELDSNSTFYTVNGGGGNPVAFSSLGGASFTAVPEPSSILLLGIAGITCVSVHRCRRKN